MRTAHPNADILHARLLRSLPGPATTAIDFCVADIGAARILRCESLHVHVWRSLPGDAAVAGAHHLQHRGERIHVPGGASGRAAAGGRLGRGLARSARPTAAGRQLPRGAAHAGP